MKLIVTTISASTAAVAFPVQNLDASNVKAFRDAILPVTTAYEIVLLDMSALNFVDSSGLGSLLSSLRAM